jgi:hypothetical protein
MYPWSYWVLGWNVMILSSPNDLPTPLPIGKGALVGVRLAFVGDVLAVLTCGFA